MGLSIKTNVESLGAQRNLSQTQKTLAANFGRLSSGLRINTAADDAAGLAISERLKSQIRSLGQAERNANDGISLLQTAEGALNENSGLLIRMRELAMQASTDTVGTAEKALLQTEFDELVNEIGRIADVTQFNGVNLLDGTQSTFNFQVGIGATSSDTITATMVSISTSAYGTAGDLGALDIATSSSSAASALSTLDTAISETSKSRASLGSVQNRLQVTVSNLQSARENLSAANSRIRDVDVAEESSALTRNNILLQAGVAVLSQANLAPQAALSLLR
jgi:flagellin